MAEESLFYKYGGFATVGAIVHSFYEKVLDEEQLRHYFEGIDMPRLIRHQTDFLCMVLDGPVDYSGRDLSTAHQRLNIVVDDFFLVADLLEETLEEAGVEDEDVASVMGIVQGTKHEIVAQSASQNSEATS